MAEARKSVNHIHYIQEDASQRIDTQQGIRDHCVDFFSSLMGSDVGPNMLTQSDMDLLLPFRCSQNQMHRMEISFSKEKIKEAFSPFLEIKRVVQMVFLPSFSQVAGVL